MNEVKNKKTHTTIMEQIKNGQTARSPLFVFGLTGSAMAAIGMALSAVIWAAKLDQRHHDHLTITHMHLEDKISDMKSIMDKHDSLPAHFQAEKRLIQILEKLNALTK